MAREISPKQTITAPIHDGSGRRIGMEITEWVLSSVKGRGWIVESSFVRREDPTTGRAVQLSSNRNTGFEERVIDVDQIDIH